MKRLPESIKRVPLFYAKNRGSWRRWLSVNHLTRSAVWLVYNKVNSGMPSIRYAEAVDEALCYGWIDSKPNRFDESRSLQYFAPRNPKSNWSAVNKEKALRLIREGKMTSFGLRVIELAKKGGQWDALNDVDANVIPKDLAAALAKKPQAKKYFEDFPKSSKKNILEWIHNAKLPLTRAKRISETVKLAGKNIRANHYRQPKQSSSKKS